MDDALIKQFASVEARIAEASRLIQEDVRNTALVAKDVEYLKRDVAEMKGDLKGKFVTQDQFEPIKKIVYGLVALILTAVVVALLGTIIIKLK